MTISQLLEQEKNNYKSFEIYRYISQPHKINICYLDNLTEKILDEYYTEINVIDFEILNKEMYNKNFFESDLKDENEYNCFPCLIIIIDYDLKEDYQESYDDLESDLD